MIDRYQLRYFLAVVEAGNFSRAAGQVNVTQPTLSAGIAKLERSLGTKLFFRNSQRVNLTEAGSRFLEHARAIENEFAEAERSVGHRQVSPLVRLGVLNTLPAAFLARIIERHSAAEARDRIEIVEGGERDLLSRLDRGRLDAALTLIRGPSAQVAQERLFREGYSLAVPETHRLAHLERIDAGRLAGEVMIVRRHCEVLSETSRHFTERGVRPEFSYRSVNDERVLELVRAGLGITVMPDGYQAPGVRRLRLIGFDLRREIGLVYRGPDAEARTGSLSLLPAVRAIAGT